MAEGIAKAHPMKRIGEGKDAAAMAKVFTYRRKLLDNRTNNWCRWWKVFYLMKKNNKNLFLQSLQKNKISYH